MQGGINQYAYVGNNPTNFTDPNGLLARDISNFSTQATSYFSSGIQTLNETLTAGSIVGGFFLGVGPDHWDFDENSIQSYNLSQTPAFDRARDMFFRDHGQELVGKTDWSGVIGTNYGKPISFSEGLSIWNSPTGAYVGSFRVDSIVGGPNKTLTYTLFNDTHLDSLTGRIFMPVFGSISYDRIPELFPLPQPLSTVSQTYIVKEAY